MITKKYYKLVRVNYEDSGYLYLKNVSDSNGIFQMKKTYNPSTSTNLEYSLDGLNWSSYNFTTLPEIQVASGSHIYFRGTNSNGFNGASTSDNGWSFYMSVNHTAGGNVFSLRNPDPTVFQNLTFVSGKRDCLNLFKNDIYLTDASSINFGASTELNAGSNNTGCSYMFAGCSGLHAIPDMSDITKIENYGCLYMFQGCTSLTTAPDLSSVATVGSSGCSFMFNGCSNLSSVTAPNISEWNTSNFSNWLQYAGSSVSDTKTFYKPTNLTIPTDSNSGVPTGWTVENY